MAFGDSATLLDDFNRANAENLGADWTTGFLANVAQDIVSNQLGDDAQFAAGSDYYDVSTYGADCECYLTLTQIGDHASDDSVLLAARVVQPGTATSDGYCVQLKYVSAGNDNVRIGRLDDGAATWLGATMSSDDFSAGDELGIECISDQISAYRNDGSWSSLGSRTDSDHGAAGYLGVSTYRAGTTQLLMDDFYGGTVAGESASVSPSVSPSASASLSPSSSVSASTSASVSPSPSPGAVGEVTWGHDTGVLEANIRDFSGNWTGTGAISGAGDAETLDLETTEYMISEIVNTDTDTVELLQNNYDPSGDDVDMDYRHGNTPAACVAAGWNNYTVPFVSLGYVQIRMTSLL